LITTAMTSAITTRITSSRRNRAPRLRRAGGLRLAAPEPADPAAPAELAELADPAEPADPEGVSSADGPLASSALAAGPASGACRCASVVPGPAAELAAWSWSRGGDSTLSSEPASGSAPGVTPLIRAPSANLYRVSGPPRLRPAGRTSHARAWTAHANPQRRRHPPELSAIAAPPERQPAQPRRSDSPAIANGNHISPDTARNPDKAAND
jgi:hypothetical protein